MQAPNQSPVPYSSPPNIAGPETGRASSLYSSSIGLLIADLAANMEPLPTILRRYALSKPQFQALLANETFRQAIRAQKSLFAAAANLPHRIQLKAQLAVEELMGDMIAITSNPSQPGAARVAAYSKLQALTGLERPEAPQPKPKFSLVLNIATNTNGDPSEVPNYEVVQIKGEIDAATEETEQELSLAGLPAEPDGRVTRSGSEAIAQVGRGGWRAGIATPVATFNGKAPPKAFERAPVSIISQVTAK